MLVDIQFTFNRQTINKCKHKDLIYFIFKCFHLSNIVTILETKEETYTTQVTKYISVEKLLGSRAASHSQFGQILFVILNGLYE